MAAEDQMVTLLKAAPDVAAIVGSRVHLHPAPQGTPSPFLTYQLITSQRAGYSYNAEASHYVPTIQIDCWADDLTDTNAQSRYRQVTGLARAVKAALDGQGLAGEERVDLIRWDSWTDFLTATETRRSLDFTLMVRE